MGVLGPQDPSGYAHDELSSTGRFLSRHSGPAPVIKLMYISLERRTPSRFFGVAFRLGFI